jgi:hypothetical protein
MPQGVFCQHSVKPRTFNTVYLWTLCISSYIITLIADMQKISWKKTRYGLILSRKQKVQDTFLVKFVIHLSN